MFHLIFVHCTFSSVMPPFGRYSCPLSWPFVLIVFCLFVFFLFISVLVLRKEFGFCLPQLLFIAFLLLIILS